MSGYKLIAQSSLPKAGSSEAGHYTLFINLADTYNEKEKVRKRWREWIAYETGVMEGMDVRGDRIH